MNTPMKCFGSCRLLLNHGKDLKSIRPRRLLNVNYYFQNTDVQQRSLQTLSKALNLVSSNGALYNHNSWRGMKRKQAHVIEEDEDTLLADQMHKDAFKDEYLLPSTGHKVFVLHPAIKWGPQKNYLTTADLQIDEACALVNSLPRWSTSDKMIYSVKSFHKKQIFGSGNFEEIKTMIRSKKDISAVFVNVNMLTSVQLAHLQRVWRLPVYDRYTLVLQIFQTRAQTREAKLQVALAEIPYLRSRMRGIHKGHLAHQRGGLQHLGGSGETFMETRHRLLQERELKIKKALATIKSKRSVMKQDRHRRELPTVAVVGYTNAGKSSLIRVLTQDITIKPMNRLFATLDVTAHACQLPNHMHVLFIDTVGFIADIPTDLIASFSATLEDMIQADVIIHVCDASHPSSVNQKKNVIETLSSLQLPEKVQSNIIEVHNKADLVDNSILDPSHHYISTVTGQGLAELAIKVQDAVIEATGRISKFLKIPMSGQHLSWLHREAVVEGTHPVPDDTESLMVKAILTQAQYAKFKSTFGQRKN